MKKIILINTPNLPCPGSHYLHTIKFLKSFKYFNYDFIEINDINNIKNIEDSKNNIIYISDHCFSLNKYENEIDILSEYKQSVFILWFFHNKLEYANQKFNKWILTGEHYRKPPLLEGHLKSYILQNSLNNYVPLTFATNIHPNDIKIKDNFDNYIYDCNYIGFTYNTDWSDFLNAKLNCFIKYTPPFITEDERIYSFNNSLCSLGFQHPANKQNFCITERIFEALSYSCLLFVDSEFIADEIKNGVVYVKSPQEIVDKIIYFKNNIDELKYIVTNGIEYIKNKGTYYHTCDNFIKKINSLY